MKKRLISFALILAMVLSMTTVTFAAESKDWESDIDVVQLVMVGDDAYASLDDAFDAQIETGAKCVSLSDDMTVEDLLLPEGACLNLNGYTLTANSFDMAPAAKIIDTTGGDGLLVVKGDCKFAYNNPQLPVKDGDAGFRFFEVEVKSVAVTGKNSTSPKYWFQVKFTNFEKVNELIKAGSEMDIKVNVTLDGVKAEATADNAFLRKWASTYENNESIYITAKIVDTEGKAISAIPGIAANGVEFGGKAM